MYNLSVLIRLYIGKSIITVKIKDVSIFLNTFPRGLVQSFSIFCSLSRQCCPGFLAVKISLHLLEFCINGIVSIYLFGLYCLASSLNGFWGFTHVLCRAEFCFFFFFILCLVVSPHWACPPHCWTFVSFLVNEYFR